MALLTTIIPSQDGSVAAFAASAPAGDTVKWSGGDVILEFRNGHASSITITIPKTLNNVKVADVGNVVPPDRVEALAAGAECVFRFKRDEISGYLNNGILAINYTSGNAALVVRVLEIP